ncbi:hypothetical protein NPIL_550191 [Nephila pilipes]|uniref:Uncharacterized protein n=1 Tax=Nephila pilipes TaxID=299642 RepID=A0A8X6N3F0_NEPPI|nr:hypothetical protein NPIL_550191 [Nephila pilipes]
MSADYGHRLLLYVIEISKVKRTLVDDAPPIGGKLHTLPFSFNSVEELNRCILNRQGGQTTCPVLVITTGDKF